MSSKLSSVRIVGSGLIGTSIGLGLVQQGIAVQMVDADPKAQSLANDLVGGEEVVDPEPDRCCAPPLLFWPSPEYQDEIDGGFIRVRSLGLGLGAEYGSFNDTSRLFRCNGFPIKQIINSIAGSSLESFGKRDVLDKVRTASEINENFLRANASFIDY